MFTNFIFILFSNINNNIPLNISLRKNRCHIKKQEGRQYFVKKYKNIYTITLPFSDTNFCTHKRIFFFKNIKRCRSLSFG
ncbi:hypothetical protein PFMALIP_03769 [Plasmodium falciparum MaliPS096_E11]|uniref:Uncharacterized protein n=2 Tax=Plasmodium falciparum TaxID=5833 RepID=A0A024WNT7_PLAFA|nr:hypothetical protein PFFVO_03483 [Plasmodium falciparum Vietnam Oak-Knoll (FVO)]ETW48201.1 hypothetical protein PFMALIP_03769 [Plasmodium falciparum MaliPS096_E11]